jgi:hypothetical protein
LTTKAQSPEQPALKSLTGPQGPSPTPANSPPLGPSSQPAPQGIEVNTLGGLDNDALGALADFADRGDAIAGDRDVRAKTRRARAVNHGAIFD